jgi:hypothetical protein
MPTLPSEQIETIFVRTIDVATLCRTALGKKRNSECSDLVGMSVPAAERLHLQPINLRPTRALALIASQRIDHRLGNVYVVDTRTTLSCGSPHGAGWCSNRVALTQRID